MEAVEKEIGRGAIRILWRRDVEALIEDVQDALYIGRITDVYTGDLEPFVMSMHSIFIHYGIRRSYAYDEEGDLPVILIPAIEVLIPDDYRGYTYRTDFVRHMHMRFLSREDFRTVGKRKVIFMIDEDECEEIPEHDSEFNGMRKWILSKTLDGRIRPAFCFGK